MLPDHDYHELAVADVVDETDDTRSFRFDVPPGLRTTFDYAAGQFCTFRAVIDGAEVVRCYSMSSSPHADEPLTTTVKRVPGGRMSNWMNDTLTPGSTIHVMRPTGLFVLQDHDTPIVAFAGGSGITPVISIVKSALATTARPILLVDANRDADAVIFADELERLHAASGGRLALHHHLDRESGLLDAEACAVLAADARHADFYVCGPTPFMDVVNAGLTALGVPDERRLVERFVLTDDGDGTDADAPRTGPETLVIRLGKRKHTVDYRAGDTLLETARRAGLNPPFSCEAGNCATCMAHLDVGSVRMRANNALTPEELEDGWVLTCQSVPTSTEITVDYDA